MSNFGVTLKGGKRASVESIIISGTVCLLLLASKWLLVEYSSLFTDQRLIQFELLDWTYLTYALVVPLQEFISRGVVQGSISRLLIGRYNHFWGVIVTSLIFGALHLHSSLELGVAAMVSSWLWGWMYARHGNIVGVSISHFFVSNFAGLLGFWAFL